MHLSVQPLLRPHPLLPHTSSRKTLSPSISLQAQAHCGKQGVNLCDPAEVLETTWGGGVGESGGGRGGEGAAPKIKAGHQLEPGLSLPIQPDKPGFVSLRLELRFNLLTAQSLLPRSHSPELH